MNAHSSAIAVALRDECSLEVCCTIFTTLSTLPSPVVSTTTSSNWPSPVMSIAWLSHAAMLPEDAGALVELLLERRLARPEGVELVD